MAAKSFKSPLPSQASPTASTARGVGLRKGVGRHKMRTMGRKGKR